MLLVEVSLGSEWMPRKRKQDAEEALLVRHALLVLGLKIQC